MSFGEMPIANGFLESSEFDREHFYDMSVAFCERCKMVQLIEQPQPEQMFNETYAFFSGSSLFMAEHFEKFAGDVMAKFLRDVSDPFVVEIGSNDGIMLRHYAQKGIKHLGIEPSANVAEIARKQGINTIVEFFNRSVAEDIVQGYGQADVFLAANVMCHIPYINSIAEGIKVLLKPGGIAVFEDPYLGDVIRNTTYDQIYDEHTFLFSVHSVQYLFSQIDMEVIEVEPQDTHGGSMRYFIAAKGVRPIGESVQMQLQVERTLGLTSPETFDCFREKCERYRVELINLLRAVKSQSKSIAGYAATSKSTTIINYCGITTEHLDCIYDTTPIKIGRYSPGAHIPIVDHAEFRDNYPDFALLFGYNHKSEIMAKEQDFIANGGRWITYVPQVRVLE